MHPYILTKLAQARTDDLQRRATYYSRVHAAADVQRRHRWTLRTARLRVTPGRHEPHVDVPGRPRPGRPARNTPETST